MEVEKYRTGLKRFWAAIVDSVIFMPLLLIHQWLFKSGNTTIIIIWLIAFTFLPIFYSIVLHYKYGQTIGKWVAGVKVLHISETRKINLNESILRDSIYLAVEVMVCAIFYLK
jgi:uncharacterized RDD family membrane protein YckC